ncbi:MAG TPA: sulfatase, partial [Planctomycetota bacterium]|nr:sulfatase [Planctomycetota bacterium]
MERDRPDPQLCDRRSLLTAGALGSLWLAAGCGKGSRRKRPNVVVITLDTTRADHLGCYGYQRPTSPNLDHLAEQSVLYGRAISPSSWTLPAHVSLFTGKLPTSHGVCYDARGSLNLGDAVDTKGMLSYRARALPAQEVTLAQILSARGFATGAFVAGPWLKRLFGLDRGFAHYDDGNIEALRGRLAEDVTASALRWLEGQRGKPFFLFLNYFDPHTPYDAPPPYRWAFLSEQERNVDPAAPRGEPRSEEERRQLAIDLYDGEIRYMDHHVGQLLAGLDRLGMFDDTLLVVTGDHGELLGEHGNWGHGKFLTEPELHVPLFLRYPRGERGPERIGGLVQPIDVLPMVLERLEIAPPPGIQGGVPPGVGHPVVAEVYPLPEMSPHGSWRALYEGKWKYAWNSLGNHLLMDLESDPG